MATDQPIQGIPSGKTSSTASLHDERTLEKQEQSFNDSKESFPIADSPPVEQDAVREEKAVTPNPMDPASFPDGGTRAWLVVLGAFCCLTVSFGWINCIGVFQAYYQTHQLREFSPQEIAWIPSLEAFCMFFGGLWVGRIYDNYGPRMLLLVGTFLHVFGLMMASISTQYWHFILSQGLCSATGASMLFYPAMNATFTWFWKKRAFALGIVASGSGLGGIIFPIMVNRLIPQVGFGWAMRICAFFILFLGIIANLTVVSRLPPSKRSFKLSDFYTPLKEVPFIILCIGSFLMFLGLFQPFTYIILAGEHYGVPPHLAEYLIPVLNAGSIFGRIVPGKVGDHIGRFTVFAVTSLAASITVLTVWLPTSGTAAAFTFAVVFGFFSGAVVSLPPTLIAMISDVRRIGVSQGVVFAFIAVAVLIGSPIGGQLITADDGSFRTMMIFSGVMTMAGSVAFFVLRWKMGGLSLRKKV